MKDNDKNLFYDEQEITGNIKLLLDKDFDKLMEISEKTGIPLTFRGERIIDFKIDGDPDHDNSIKPDMIEIGPPAFYFDLKFGENEFKNVPFNRQIITNEIFVFKSTFYSKLDINLKIKFKLDAKNLKVSLNITINPKSNKIKDILNYEIRKREFSNGTFQLIPFGKTEFKIIGELPEAHFDNDELNFYKKVNYINEKLKLNLILDDDYVISNDDLKSANMICEFIKNKKISLKPLPLSMKTTISGLNYLLTQKNKQLTLKQNEYSVNLLGNEIKLGSYKIEIDHYEILNYDELNEIYNKNINNTELIEITAILKEKDSDELYMDFNTD